MAEPPDDIDIACGGIVEGPDTVDAVGERIFHLMLATASGRSTKSELHGYGQNESVPWQRGDVRWRCWRPARCTAR